MAALRAPGGCPWDREQTLDSLRPYLLEEAYEVLDAMVSGDPESHREELGDLLFQVVFQSQIRAEQGHFQLADVVESISDKLERRHPHVFGDEDSSDAEEVSRRWEELKAQEGKGKASDVPRALPALMRATAVGRRVSRTGFDWPDVQGPLAKLSEEVTELSEAITSGDPDAVSDELGDVLFAAINVSRHVEVDGELALQAATDRFLGRYHRVLAALDARGISVEDAQVELLDQLWAEAKKGAG